MGRYIHKIGDIYSANIQTVTPDGRRVAAVALPDPAGSLRAAWEVFTGRAYAIRWPKPGELEAAIGAAPHRSLGKESEP